LPDAIRGAVEAADVGHACLAGFQHRPPLNLCFAPELAALLAISAGALIYVGTSHLMPTAEREPRRYSLVALGSGVLIAVGIIAKHG
jgi:zinc transporter ZupT